MPTGSRPPRRSAPSAMAASSSVGRARRAQDAALREGDDLDGDEVAEALADLQDLVEVLQAELVVDVDVAAHVQRAAGHDLAHQIGAGLRFGNGARRAHLALGLDAVGDAIARRLVGNPGQAEQRLVEMDMAVDQRRQDQRAAEIEVAAPGGRGGGRRSALPEPRCRACCRRAAWRWLSRTPLLVGDGARFLAGLRHGGARGHGHQAEVVGDGARTGSPCRSPGRRSSPCRCGCRRTGRASWWRSTSFS